MTTPPARPASATRVRLARHSHGGVQRRDDWVATEEPLEVRLQWDERGALRTQSVSITMRTPGHDFELAAGFLYGEGVVQAGAEIEAMAYCVEAEQRYNVVNVRLRPGTAFDPAALQRHFYATSSCGVCGKASLDALARIGCAPLPDGFEIAAERIGALPEALRAAQPLFERTGGLHAAGLFDEDGALHALREDVGRHNAVDKVVGHALMHGGLPLGQRALVLSGRAGFELVQKALRAGIPVVVSVGAPSSLAVDLARRFNLTLLGFVGPERFNAYSGEGRLA